jgi:hypothetical protein
MKRNHNVRGMKYGGNDIYIIYIGVENPKVLVIVAMEENEKIGGQDRKIEEIPE